VGGDDADLRQAAQHICVKDLATGEVGQKNQYPSENDDFDWRMYGCRGLTAATMRMAGKLHAQNVEAPLGALDVKARLKV
jgi:hypothetical protein